MLSIASIGLTEIAILTGVIAVACGLPLIGAALFLAFMLKQAEDQPVEQE